MAGPLKPLIRASDLARSCGVGLNAIVDDVTMRYSMALRWQSLNLMVNGGVARGSMAIEASKFTIDDSRRCNPSAPSNQIGKAWEHGVGSEGCNSSSRLPRIDYSQNLTITGALDGSLMLFKNMPSPTCEQSGYLDVNLQLPERSLRNNLHLWSAVHGDMHVSVFLAWGSFVYALFSSEIYMNSQGP
jgi:hypothetical protein